MREPRNERERQAMADLQETVNAFAFQMGRLGDAARRLTESLERYVALEIEGDEWKHGRDGGWRPPT